MVVLSSLTNWANGMSFENFPPEAVQKAKACIMDVCGVMIAGSIHPTSKIVRECLIQSPEGACRIVGTGNHAEATQAALSNAYSAHVWDFDDTCYAGIVHPSAVIFPTILALGEELKATGEDIISAYIIGLEIQGKVGEAVSPHLFMKGWFTTSVLGVIGATAAAAKLLRLSPIEIGNAIGIALCQAGGIRQNNGTSTKPFAVGRAAEHGILSARMASNGLKSSPEILEGPEGFFQIYCNGQYKKSVFAQLGNPLIINSPGVSLKPYPTCSGAHSAMEAVLFLAAKHQLNWQYVKRIYCRTTPVAVKGLKYKEPLTPEQAQFCLPFCIASALKNRKLEISHLTEENFRDPAIRELMNKVCIESTENFGPDKGTSFEYPEGADIIIETIDGRSFEKFVGHAVGSPRNPFTKDELKAKFINCLKDIIDNQKIINCLELIEELEYLEDINMLSKNMVP